MVVRAVLDLRAEDFETDRKDGAGPSLRRRVGLWARAILVRLRKHGFEAAARVKDRPGVEVIVFVMKRRFRTDGPFGLVFRAHRGGVEVGIEIPPRGARKARALLGDPARAFELGASLAALPDQFAIAFAGDESHLDAAGVKVDEVRALLARADREDRTLRIGWSVARDAAIASLASLDDRLEDAIVLLAGIFVLLLGDGDGHSRSGRRRRGSPRGRSANQTDDDGTEAPARSASRSARDGRNDRTERDAEADAERDAKAPAARPQRSLDAAAILRAGRRRPTTTRSDKGRSIERGSKVRVIDGPFAGKVGIVHEVDGKGGARVMLGLLAIWVEVKNLVSSVGPRPRLSTSHRKPVPARS
jgi:hypothetical protein